MASFGVEADVAAGFAGTNGEVKLQIWRNVDPTPYISDITSVTSELSQIIELPKAQTQETARLPVAMPRDNAEGRRNDSLPKATKKSSTIMIEQLVNPRPEPQGGWSKRLWTLMSEPGNHPVALGIHHAYNVFIIVSVVCTITGTLDTLEDDFKLVLDSFEILWNSVFTLEVLVRVGCAPRPLRVLRSMYTCMDIGAIIPFYIMAASGNGDRDMNIWVELLWFLMPIMRLLKITRHSAGWRILIKSIHQCIPALVVPSVLLALLTIFMSSLIFWVEKHTACQGDHCELDDMQAFRSIPHTMWFAIVTISTVGFGDVSPNTDAAKFVAAFLILAGVCYMAMPLSIIGGTFSQVWDDRDRIILREKTTNLISEGGVGMDDLRALFDAADADGSGTVTKDEFTDLVAAFGLGLPREQVIKLFKSIDDNHGGSITFDEFASFLYPDLDMDGSEDDDSDESESGPPQVGGAPSETKDRAPPEAWGEVINGDSTASSKANNSKACKTPSTADTAHDSHGEELCHIWKARLEAFGRRVVVLEESITEMRAEQRHHFEAQRQSLQAIFAIHSSMR
mmetsp:Transcript_15236/g.31988  ORF Transcript_15236/g.31988 Transcript_15236/m.31988 type:complete len:567 (+) Transcript_15236:97-1797(+)